MKLKRGEDGEMIHEGPSRWGIAIRDAITRELIWIHDNISRRTAMRLCNVYSEEGFQGRLPGQLLITVGHSKHFKGDQVEDLRGEQVREQGSGSGSAAAPDRARAFDHV